MKNLAVILIALISGTISASAFAEKEHKVPFSPEDENFSGSIQVALLLDTSNSMDGLINQAKSRLWNIVNTLTTLRFDGEEARIEIALYEYGNDGLPAESGYIRQVVGLTGDLDLISEHLFALGTNGGSEYCGAVIQNATKKLDWNTDSRAMKLIYIAGNEPFDQGTISYKEAISDAVNDQLFVNTIFCGSGEEGIRTFWKDGAERGKGKYFNIDSNAVIRHIATPYDDRITRCNQLLNNTYVGYGSYGQKRLAVQNAQDEEAEEISFANIAERTVSKASRAYRNESWDLVDKIKSDPDALEKIPENKLPEEMRGKTRQEMRDYVNRKKAEREKIQAEIAELAKKRQAYIEKEQARKGVQDDLGKVITVSILEIARAKGYKQ
ncbi:vWA domain-containing protein [Sinomicrobium soli]|uniref:vWA domain-containing protein n=1 Tax=Sinomicrobium sp. N-1-3-6 TaxID=2219864 RepID=UPI000DCB392B|nr:VWA domain-containing protein [Sinomicrobium sp. N-1-3-6]RAV28820.1 hypothetical protein DN748_10455 [Sinomicrobium sp. N-1-3-6]